MRTPILDVRGVKKAFDAQPVLNGVELKAHAGDVISILGSSGSGKSTFLRCINLLEIPDAGEISIDGEAIGLVRTSVGKGKIADLKQVERLRRQLAMVFQSFNLWGHMTVRENIMIAPIKILGKSKQEAGEMADALMERVGVYPRKDAYPTHLSGGQKQRAAIARALAMEPKALLFDEPTSALDPELVGEVLKVMRELADEGRTMLVVTHELGFARDVSDEVMFLHKGVVERSGPPKEMFGAADESSKWSEFLAHAQM